MRRATVAAGAARALTLEEWAALDEEVEGELVDGILEEEEMPSFLHRPSTPSAYSNAGPMPRYGLGGAVPLQQVAPQRVR